MDLLEVGNMGSGHEDDNCSLAFGFPENCLYPESHEEESWFGLIELVCVTVIYIPLMLFGLLGNILTILVVWLRPHMRSSTYLYLSSMAVSDLLILLLLPLDLYKLWRPSPWPFGDLACKLTVFLSECCTFCTILHITFLSLERYLAVCWPITAKTLVTRRRTRALIGCLWLGAAASAAPIFVMVGVEEVGGEELRFRGSGGWTGREGEQGELTLGGRGRESGNISSIDGGLEGIYWEEKEGNKLGDKVELKWFEEKGEGELGITERGESKQDDDRQGIEGNMEVEGEQQNKMKEDEGGGMAESVDGGHGGEIDRRECRCTEYAVSSGLLSAMMILSNLYFLVPLFILGLVYSLIGRTLWLRPQSSRKDQSHRHTVKMLGVIVLAFVLCWLPFHVGRTIYSLTRGSETYTDPNSHLDINTLADVSIDRNTSIHTVTTPICNSGSDTHLKTPSMTEKMTAHVHRERDEILCDTCAKVRMNTHTDVDKHLADKKTETQTDMGTRSDDMSTDKHFVLSHTREQQINNGERTLNLDPSIETDTHPTAHIEVHNDVARVDTQSGRFTEKQDTNNHTHNSTNTTTHSDTHRIAHLIKQVLHSNSSFHTNTNKNTNAHTNRPCCADVHTLTSIENWTSSCIHAQNTPNRTPPTAGINTYAVTPADLYDDNTLNDAHFNNTHKPPDTYSQFAYYLSQYFNLASSFFFYLSAAVNPLLYNLMSARYRHAVHSLIHTHSQTQSHRLRTLTTRHSTSTL